MIAQNAIQYLYDNYKTRTNSELCKDLKRLYFEEVSEAYIRNKLMRAGLRRTPEDWLLMAENGSLQARKMYAYHTRTKTDRKPVKTHRIAPKKVDNRVNPDEIRVKPMGKLVQVGKNIWKEVKE